MGDLAWLVLGAEIPNVGQASFHERQEILGARGIQMGILIAAGDINRGGVGHNAAPTSVEVAHKLVVKASTTGRQPTVPLDSQSCAEGQLPGTVRLGSLINHPTIPNDL